MSQPAQNSIRGLLNDGQYYPTKPFQFQFIMVCSTSKKATNRVSCKVKTKLSIIRILPYSLRDIMRRLVQEIKKERMGKNRSAVRERQNTKRNTQTQKIVLKKKSLQLFIGKGRKGQISLMIIQQEPKASRAFIPKFEITQNMSILKLPTPFALKRLYRILRQRCTHPQLSLIHLSQKIRKAVQVKKTVYRMKSPMKRLSKYSRNIEQTANKNFNKNSENILRLRNCRKLILLRYIDSLSWLQYVKNSQLIVSLALVMLFLSMCSSKDNPKLKNDSRMDSITNSFISMSLGRKQEKSGQLNCLSGKTNLSKVIPWSVKYSGDLLPRQDSCQFCTITINGRALLSQTNGQLIQNQHFVPCPISTFIKVFQSSRTYSQNSLLFFIYVLFQVVFFALEAACFSMTQLSRH